MKSTCAFLLLLMLACPALGKAVGITPLGKIDSLQRIERSHAGEWIQLFVSGGQVVVAGQRLAVQRNALGRVVLEYVAGSSGEVTIDGRVALGPRNTTLEIEMLTGGHGCAAQDCHGVASD